MRYSIILLFLVLVSFNSSSQDFLLLNLRSDLFQNAEVCDSGNECFGLFDLELVNDSSLEMLHNTENSFKRLDRQTWLNYVEGKRVLIVVHGMAKGWAEANKDLCNVYWSLQHYTTDLYDVVIGVSWPGSSYLGISPYIRANRESLKSAKLLGPLAKSIGEKAYTMDIMTHSMGSKVMCKMIKKDDVHFDQAFLLAPSILRNSLKPLKRWRKTLKNIDSQMMIFHSNGDWAFNWTAMQHLGMGYSGMKHRKVKRYDKLTQVNCDEVVNQRVYKYIERNAFSSRSNHSYYTQCPEVFQYIQAVSQGPALNTEVVLTRK